MPERKPVVVLRPIIGAGTKSGGGFTTPKWRWFIFGYEMKENPPISAEDFITLWNFCVQRRLQGKRSRLL